MRRRRVNGRLPFEGARLSSRGAKSWRAASHGIPPGSALARRHPIPQPSSPSPLPAVAGLSHVSCAGSATYFPEPLTPMTTSSRPIPRMPPGDCSPFACLCTCSSRAGVPAFRCIPRLSLFLWPGPGPRWRDASSPLEPATAGKQAGWGWGLRPRRLGLRGTRKPSGVTPRGG